MIKAFLKAIPAGMLIAVGAAAYLLSGDKYIGAVLFCIGLFVICAYKLNLFTGKIGYIFRDKNPLFCLVVWAGNLFGCIIAAFALRFARPELAKASRVLIDSKMENTFFQTSVLAIFCGILIYIAVDNFINNGSPVLKLAGILLCVPVFIICGFEHSIADMCYFLFCITPTAKDISDFAVLILNVSVFNGVGSIIYRLLTADIKK